MDHGTEAGQEGISGKKVVIGLFMLCVALVAVGLVMFRATMKKHRYVPPEQREQMRQMMPTTTP